MTQGGDRDPVAPGHSFHAVRPDAFNYVWDNNIEPVLEVDSGEVVEFTVRDASDEQIQANSTSEDVAKLDFEHVNPVSGPVYVKGARPEDVGLSREEAYALCSVAVDLRIHEVVDA